MHACGWTATRPHVGARARRCAWWSKAPRTIYRWIYSIIFSCLASRQSTSLPKRGSGSEAQPPASYSYAAGPRVPPMRRMRRPRRVAQADPSALAALRRHSARRSVRGSTGVRPGPHPPRPASRLLLAGGGVWLACSGFSEDPKRILDTVPKFSQMLSSDWPPLNLALA